MFFSSTYQWPITFKEIALVSKYDPVIAKVIDFTINGWPKQADEAKRSYSNQALQLTVDHNCLFWGSRVVIPPTHRQDILKMLHTDPPGKSRMKSLKFLWWPNLDSEIKNTVRECMICQKTRKSTPLAPLQPWVWPRHNWQRLHLDFAHLDEKDFLILADSHFKWIEIFHMTTTTSSKTIEKLRHCFAAYGLPVTVVTDDGPQFKSVEFRDFLKSNGVHYVLTPPFHPTSNGLAERAVQTIKDAFLRQLLQDSKTKVNRSLQHCIDSLLFVY